MQVSVLDVVPPTTKTITQTISHKLIATSPHQSCFVIFLSFLRSCLCVLFLEYVLYNVHLVRLNIEWVNEMNRNIMFY